MVFIWPYRRLVTVSVPQAREKKRSRVIVKTAALHLFDKRSDLILRWFVFLRILYRLRPTDIIRKIERPTQSRLWTHQQPEEEKIRRFKWLQTTFQMMNKIRNNGESKPCLKSIPLIFSLITTYLVEYVKISNDSSYEVLWLTMFMMHSYVSIA